MSWIRAVALEGYKLAGRDSNYQWKLNFDDVDQSKCVVPVSPTPTYATCTAAGAASARDVLEVVGRTAGYRSEAVGARLR